MVTGAALKVNEQMRLRKSPKTKAFFIAFSFFSVSVDGLPIGIC
jgi:hypothetical protein